VREVLCGIHWSIQRAGILSTLRQPSYIPGKTKAQKRFSTILIGPVVQALYGSREIAGHMHYLEKALCNVPTGRLSDLDARGCFS
jgi:hypothetical protein